MSSDLESELSSIPSHSHKRPLERIETHYPRYVHATITPSPTLSSSSSYLSLASISSSSPSSPELKRRCYISTSNLLSNPRYNKGLAFSHAERTSLSLHGLLPAQVMTQEQQVAQTVYNVNKIQDGLEKYQYLMSLLARNEKLFFRTVVENVTQMLPILYTPTVGRACQEWGRIYQHPRGLHLSINDRSHIHSILAAYPCDDIRAIVFTDGERILGLGDLGAQGHGIPIGKLLLYTACAGVRPEYCLPITLDVGTNNTTLINDPNYPGLRSPRVRGAEYDTFIDEFIMAVKERWGEYTLLQFEDFGNANAARLLDIYRDRCCTFNDDIQGTAAVGVAGIIAALRLTESKHLSHHRVMFYGSGSAGIGIASLIAYAISCEEGITIDEARKNIYLVDSQGLVTTSRTNLTREKKPWAQDRAPIANDLATIVAEIRPTALIGVCAIPQTFTEKVIRLMASHTSRPIIFALSNPTSKAECTAQQAYEWTDGKALFASGSPFDPVTINGRTYVPGQGNNSYIFPGLSLAVVSCGAKRVPDELFLVAASHLASLVSEEDLAASTLYPPMANIREVSMEIAVAVAHEIYRLNLATITPKPHDMLQFMRDHVYDHFYAEFVTSQL